MVDNNAGGGFGKVSCSYGVGLKFLEKSVACSVH